MADRKIKTNLPDLEVPNNKISTSKYTKITFFPKNLFEQFSKLSNAYFLVKLIFSLILLKNKFSNKKIRLLEFCKYFPI